MNNELTDKELWKEYWKNYRYEKISDKVIYKDYLPRLKGKQSFIEIGGFPGANAIYFYRNICKDSSLLDFYIDMEMVNKLECINDVPINSINCIESDFFKYNPEKQYDIVCSVGFIEHFEDTEDVIQKHIELLSDNGTLLIVLPNFRGLNGFIQYLFDRENLKIHNLNSMKITNLKQIIRKTDLKNIEIRYTKKPMLWVEPKPKRGNKLVRKVIYMLSCILKIVPVRCRLLSPYIIIYAEK